MTNWIHFGSSFGASFLASLVEFVEALTIVLAIGITRGWKTAITATLAGVATLAVLIVVFGPALEQIPIRWLQLVIGALVLIFGSRWLAKAIRRSAGVIPLRDEDQIFAKELNQYSLAKTGPKPIDKVGFVAVFKAILLEGAEVVFIVVTTGSVAGNLSMATAGATAAGLLVLILGLLIHRPLSKVPENTLKFAVGIMLTAFGIFWVGEGLGVEWPGADWFLIALAAAIFGASLVGVRTLERK